MTHCCFKQGCIYEVQYVCLCLCCETFCCEFHLEVHLKLRNRTHSFNSILVEPYEWSKIGILEFLTKECLKKEKLKKIALAFLTKNCYKSIEESLREVDSDLEKIKDLTEKVSKLSDKDGKIVLNPSDLIFNRDAERSEAIHPEAYRSVMLFCISSQLRNKKWVILNRVNNDLETEQDFREACALYENLAYDPLLSQVFQEYINAYHKIVSLYDIPGDNELLIYNTETETEVVKALEFPASLDILDIDYEKFINFPSGDLFFIGNYTLFIIDGNYRVRKMKAPKKVYNAVFFYRSIYCFGTNINYNYSWRFDLDENRWSRFSGVGINLIPEGNKFEIRNSIIFNGNIIIAGRIYRHLLLYSIDIDSFSEIPYEFNFFGSLKMINAEKRLYLINYQHQGPGSEKKFCGIYESEIGNAYSWNWIPFNEYIRHFPISCTYNKGGIYISSHDINGVRTYFKFDLFSKILNEIACYSEHLALKKLDDKLEVIECYNHTFKLDPDIAAIYIDKGYKLAFLVNVLEKIETFSEHIERKPSKYKNYYKKAVQLHKIGRDLEAAEFFSRGIKLNDKNAKKHYEDIADTFYNLGNYHKAIEFEDKYMKLYSKDWEPCFKKGLCLNELGMYHKAIECYNEAVKKPISQEDQINFRKGCAFYNLGNNIEALECYNKVTEQNPNTYFLLRRANLLNDLERETEAFKDINKACDFINWECLYDSVSNSIWCKYSVELLRAIANLQRNVVDLKEKLQKIKDESLEHELFKKYETKWQEIKIEQSIIFKTAAECFNKFKAHSIKNMQQIIKEVDELRCALINIIHQ